MSHVHQPESPGRPDTTGVRELSTVCVRDELLVARLASGDASAIGALFDTWCDTVYTLVARLVGATHDAEIIVEAVFVHASCRAATYRRERGTPCAWLLAIARAQVSASVLGESARGNDRAARDEQNDDRRAGDYALNSPYTAAV